MDGNGNNNKLAPIKEISFIRAVCALGIVIYHFWGASRTGVEFLHNFKNGTWGSTYVTVFFVVSGFVLYYNNREVKSPGTFYSKRFKSIYPMFWIAYAYFFIDGVFKSGDLFYHDQPWCIVFSVLGVDGFLQHTVPTYYYIGEWFLGAIIILYLLYPLICAIVRKSSVAALLLAAGIYALVFIRKWYLSYPIRSIPACALSFTFGMVIAKHRNSMLNNKLISLASAVIVLLLLVVDVRQFVNEFLITQFFGWCIFFVLFNIAGYVMKNDSSGRVFEFLGGLSYPIFLLQHQIIDRMMNYQNYSAVGPALIMLLMTIALTIVCAWALDAVTKAFLALFRQKPDRLHS